MSSPRTVAIIGASSDRRKFGNKAVRAFKAAGWKVYPIHPREQEVEGLATLPSVGVVPEPLDTVSLYVPATVGEALIPEIAALRPREVWVNPGAGSPALSAAAEGAQLPITFGCSILSLGLTPRAFPDQ